MSKQQKQQEHEKSIEEYQDSIADHMQNFIDMIKEIQNDFIPTIREDYKTKKDATD